MRCPILALVFLLVLGRASPLEGQLVTGTVHDRETAAPIPGAIVSLLGEGGERLVAVLTDPDGSFRVRAPAPGVYGLGVERIGFRSEVFEGFEVGPGEVLPVRLRVASRAIELPAVTVEAEQLCEIPSQEGVLISDLWDEARKALELSVAARESRSLHVRGREHERTLDLVTLRVLEERLRSWSGLSRNPYFGASPEELAREGYVREDSGGHFYFGLAPETLLSRPFEDTHCFRVRPPGRGQPETEIGLAFEPASGHPTPDVSGVLWVDRETARLLRVEYVYTRHLHSVPLPEEPFGGRTDFRWLEDGTVIVEGWRIRMPRFDRIVSTDDLPRGTVLRGGVWAERERRDQLRRVGLSVQEVGGTVTSVAVPGRAATGTAVVEGVVHDSLHGGPLAEALVYVVGTTNQAATDAEGRFRISDLPAGNLEVSFQHPLVDGLGVAPEPRDLRLAAGETVRVELATPSSATVFGARCDDGETWVAGFVRSPPDGRPAEGAMVAAEWEEGWRVLGEREVVAERVRRVAVTDHAGVYVLCDVRPGATLRISAEAEGAVRRTQVVVEAGGGGRVDFDFARRTEEVEPAETGRVALGEVPIELPELEVVARARPPRVGRLADFHYRAQRGMGSFLTREDIERRGPVTLATVLAEHGMDVVQAGSSVFGVGIVNRRTNCAPAVYLDGMRLTEASGQAGPAGEAVNLVNLRDVAGLEIYRGPSTVPGEFAGPTARCGVIVIWTGAGG